MTLTPPRVHGFRIDVNSDVVQDRRVVTGRESERGYRLAVGRRLVRGISVTAADALCPVRK